MLGGILVGMNYLLNLILPPAVVNALLIIILVILTGAMHLDGFMDTCDGSTGGSPQRRLEIMSDSHVGAFGVVGVCCLLLLKYVALSSTPDSLVLAALLLTPIMGRWTMVCTIFTFPYAKKHTGMGEVFKQQMNWQKFTLATIVTIIAAFILLGWQGLVLMAGLWLIIWVIASYLRSRLDGLTGDTYGAVNEMAEVIVLILLPLVAKIYS